MFSVHIYTADLFICRWKEKGDCKDQLLGGSEGSFTEKLQMLNACSVGSLKFITRLMVRMKMPVP